MTTLRVSDEQAIELLARLVAIPSPSRNEGEACQHLVGWLRRNGFAAEVDGAGNAVGARGQGERELLLLGHIDTFPGVVPVRREGDALFGRGSVDAKGPLAAFAVAAARVTVPSDWRVTVAGAVEEETATSKGARYLVAQRASRGPAYCVIGEPSRWDRVTLGYKGRLVLDVKLRAPFSHSAGLARLPAEVAVGLWQGIQDYCGHWNARLAEGHGAFNELSPSLRSISTTDDGTHGLALLNIGFRLPLTASPAAVESEVRRVMADAVPEAELSCTVVGQEPAFKAGKSNPLVRAFLSSVRESGGDPRFVVKTGTSDMNVVGPEWPDTAMVAYGPGDSALDHTPEEHLDLPEYLRAIRVLEGVLRSVLG